MVIGLSACLIHFYFSEIKPRHQKFGIPMAIGAFILVGLATVFALPATLGAGRYVIALLLGICAATPFLTLSPYKMHLTRFGVMVLMLSFGASFGFTVMGRISLAIGRAQELLGDDRPAIQAEQISPGVASLVSLAIVIGFLVVWRRTTNQKTA